MFRAFDVSARIERFTHHQNASCTNKKIRTMLICTLLPSYGSSIVLSSPLLSFRKHNIILSPTVFFPLIDASTWADVIDNRCCLRRGGEGTHLGLAPCSRCPTVEERDKHYTTTPRLAPNNLSLKVDTALDDLTLKTYSVRLLQTL
jgi:hypothetical protein